MTTLTIRTLGPAARNTLGVLLVIAVAVASGAWGLAKPASAASIAVLVNDEPITDYEIAQRTRLIQATSGGQAGRAQAVDELIEEKLKMQAARRLGIAVSESELSQAFNQIASQVNLSPSQFSQALGQIGVDPETLRSRLRADLAWRDIVRQQLRQEINVRDRDVEALLTERGEAATGTSIELTMRQIQFVIPSNSSQDFVRRRQQEANQFRAQFTGCDTARDLAANYRDAVVRSEIRRTSNDLPPQMRETLVNLSEGEVSPPQVTEEAVELIAVCERREVQDMEAARSEIQDSMVNEQGERLARRLMIDLKQAAIIERR